MIILLEDYPLAYLFPLKMLLGVHDRLSGFPVSCSDMAVKPRLVPLLRPKQVPRIWCPNLVMHTPAGPDWGP